MISFFNTGLPCSMTVKLDRKTDIKILALDFKIEILDFIGVSNSDAVNYFSLGDIDEPFKTEKRADQTTE